MTTRLWKGGPKRSEIASAIVSGVTGRVLEIANGRAAKPPGLGLVRFGYRYDWKDSRYVALLCTDVDLIRAPRPVDAAGIEAINRGAGVGTPMLEDGTGWNPKGYTPLTQALQEAGRVAPPGGGDIVVITDFDKDVCAPDPCPPGSATPAVRLPPRVRVRFVIASGLEPSNEGRARHLARCMGADFINPKSLTDATAAGRRVADTLLIGPQAILLLRFDGEPRLPAGFNFSDLGQELLVSSDRADSFRIAVEDSRMVVQGRPAGRYSARFREPRGAGAAPFQFTVQAGTAEPQIVLLAPATLALAARGTEGQLPHGEVTWRVTDERGRSIGLIPSTADVSVTVPPGRFKVTAVIGNVETPTQEITLAFGGHGALTFTAPGARPQARLGTLVLVAHDAAGRPVQTGIAFHVEPVAGGAPDNSPASARERQLVAGRYRIRPLAPESVLPLPTMQVQVDAGQRMTVAAVLPAPVIEVAVVSATGQTIEAPDTVFQLERLGPNGSAGKPANWRGPRLTLAVEPGRYRVTAFTENSVGHLEINVPTTGLVAERLSVAPPN